MNADQKKNIAFILSGIIVISAAIWGPEALSDYHDRSILDKIHAEAGEASQEGYRYTMSPDERLFLLSKSLDNQIIPESELSELTREDPSDVEYHSLDGTYAFVINHQGPSGRQITKDQIYQTCAEELAELEKLGILPDTLKELGPASYDAVLYSAIDVLDPRNNVSVWKITLKDNQKNVKKDHRLIEACIDADDGKIYEFYARTALSWEEADPDVIVDQWSKYVGLSSPKAYEPGNPLAETTPCYQKYLFPGRDGGKTIVTVGFYEGINELFLKISK